MRRFSANCGNLDLESLKYTFKNLILLLFLNFSVKILTINFLIYATLLGSSMEANCLGKGSSD